jgi:hypothetical protein
MGTTTSLCGARTFTISPTTYSFLSLSDNVLTLYSTVPSEASAPITVTVTAVLDDYPLITPATALFTI